MRAPTPCDESRPPIRALTLAELAAPEMLRQHLQHLAVDVARLSHHRQPSGRSIC